MSKSLNEFIQNLSLKLVGNIPQVISDINHYYGRERTEYILQFDTEDLDIFNLKNIKKFLINFRFENNNNYKKHKEKIEIFKESLIKDIDLNINYEDIILLESFIINCLKEDIKCKITIHFPQVKVTNDNDKSVIIKDVFARFFIKQNGTLIEDVTFCKTTYDTLQWDSKYIHSHITALDYNRVNEFKHSCLGRGPLSSTIPSLYLENNINLWGLFCYELDNYLQVESLVGGPYKYLEHLKSETQRNINYERISDNYKIHKEDILDIILQFVEYLIKNNSLKFSFNGNSYTLHDSLLKNHILLSNEFIKFYNDNFKHIFDLNKLFDDNILTYCKIEKNKIFSTSTEESLNYNNRFMFNFKNKPIYLKIEKNINSNIENNYSILLNKNIVNKILYYITILINDRKYYNQAEFSKITTII